MTKGEFYALNKHILASLIFLQAASEFFNIQHNFWSSCYAAKGNAIALQEILPISTCNLLQLLVLQITSFIPVLQLIFLQNFSFIYLAFSYENSRITGLQGKGEGISLTLHYHLHPLHRHLDISRTNTAESSHLALPFRSKSLFLT